MERRWLVARTRYLGSKTRLLDQIVGAIGRPRNNQRLLDVFSGTGVVSEAASKNGWSILANDHLSAAKALTSARLASVHDARFQQLGGYENTIHTLNELRPVRGFFYREYSPSGENSLGIPRPYFTENNASKIDAIRGQVKNWNSGRKLNRIEHLVLLADLIDSANQVANIAGTYGCFLREISEPAKSPIELHCRKLKSAKSNWRVTMLDAFNVESSQGDVAYLDPPYTKRQYAAYYHIPETIASGDEPTVTGITGLRPWESKASDFCYKSRAANALKRLLQSLNCKRILISYSSDGHIAFDLLISICKTIGNCIVNEFQDFARYAPNQASIRNGLHRPLTEFLVEIRR